MRSLLRHCHLRDTFAPASLLAVLLAASVSGCGKPGGAAASGGGAAGEETLPPAPLELEVAYADLGYDSKTGALTHEGNAFTGIAIETHPNGGKAKAYEVREGVFDGVVREWYEDGTPQTETHFKAGRRHGSNTYWNPDGSLLKEQLWEDGTLVEETKH